MQKNIDPECAASGDVNQVLGIAVPAAQGVYRSLTSDDGAIQRGDQSVAHPTVVIVDDLKDATITQQNLPSAKPGEAMGAPVPKRGSDTPSNEEDDDFTLFGFIC